MNNDSIEMNSGSQLNFDHSVILISLNGEETPVRAKQIRLATENGTPQCELRFEMEWLIYQQVLKGDGLGLFPAARGEGSESMFTANLPIEMKAVLRQSLAEALIAREAEAEDVLAYLLNDKTILEMPVKSIESWLATEVKQQVELPDELVPNGTLKQGYHTLWSGQLTDKITYIGPTVSMNEIVERCFDGAELSYERLDDQLLRLAIRGKEGTWVTLVRTDEDNRLCIVYSIYPQAVPEPKRTAVAALLIQENYNLPTGNFEMDLADGELRFRTGLDVGGGQLTPELFAQLITTHITVMDRYFTLIGEKCN